MRPMICKKNCAKILIRFGDISKKLKKYALIWIWIKMDCLNLLAIYLNSVVLNQCYDMEKEQSKNVQKIWSYKVRTVKNALIQILIQKERSDQKKTSAFFFRSWWKLSYDKIIKPICPIVSEIYGLFCKITYESGSGSKSMALIPYRKIAWPRPRVDASSVKVSERSIQQFRRSCPQKQKQSEHWFRTKTIRIPLKGILNYKRPYLKKYSCDLRSDFTAANVRWARRYWYTFRNLGGHWAELRQLKSLKIWLNPDLDPDAMVESLSSRYK